MTRKARIPQPLLKDYSAHRKAFLFVKAAAWGFLGIGLAASIALLSTGFPWLPVVAGFVNILTLAILLFGLSYGGEAVVDISESSNIFAIIEWEKRELES